MLVRDASCRRPVELGRYPLEALPTDEKIADWEVRQPAASAGCLPDPTNELGKAARQYMAYFSVFAQGEIAPQRAPVPTNLDRRTREIKGAAYYLDADHVGVCKIPAQASITEPSENASHAVVLLIAHGRRVESDNPASEWLAGAEDDIALMRGVEIAVSIAGHIRALGFSAEVHFPGRTTMDLDKLAVLAGIVRRHSSGEIESPFLGRDFARVVVATDYALTVDKPLSKGAKINSFRYWLGFNGATSGRERRRQAKRASHLSRYPMEQVRRVDRPTTQIFDDEIPRVPQRANFFARARHGDLGDKAQTEVQRFAYKHPLTHGLMGPLRALIPHQDGTIADCPDPLIDAETNTRAIKSLAYHLGVDLAGICEIPAYAWYSHDAGGTKIVPYHRYAVVMLIDQGYDTMEGASGDDWISGCQSMRGYLRGAEIAGVMAEFLRTRGVSARAQTNADSHVLHIPLVLLAGLGELSRIGELVLNPYVGPRFKSVVLTTDMPLLPDKPIDFGLQYFCNHCLKCARECPVNAISFGDKVIFNGYEIWKPDVERCVRYRITNQKGSACGRCMKTCPLNKVVSADGSLLHRLGTWLGVNARWLKPLLVPLAVYLDDRLEFGKRNPIKRWWLDLEIVNGVAVKPRGTNERDLDTSADTSGKRSPVGYYPARVMPTPDEDGPVRVNHKQAIERSHEVESVKTALLRRSKGGARPAQYIAISEINRQTPVEPDA